MHNERLWGRNFTSLCISNFALFLSYYTLLPTLPIYVLTQFNADSTQVGLVVTAFAVAALSSRPMGGPLMKRYGEKSVFLVATLLLLITTSLYLASSNFGFLLALRVVHGLALGIATSAGGTLAALLVPKARTGEGLGYYGMVQSSAMVIGPFLGLTLIQSLPFAVLFITCAAFSLVAVGGGFLVQALPRERSVESALAIEPRQPKGIRTLLEPAAIPVALCAFLMAFAYGGLTAFASVYGTGLGLTKLTNYFFAVYALMVVLPRPWLGRLFDKVGAKFVIYPGIVAYTAGLLLLSQASTGLGYLGSAAVIGLGFGALSSLQALAVQSVPADRKGYATSTYYFFIDGGIAIGSLLLGAVAERSNYHTMYLVAAVVVAFMALLFFRLQQRPTLLRTVTFSKQQTKASA